MSKLFWHIIDQYADPSDLEKLDNCAGIKLVGDDSMWKHAEWLSGRYPGKPIVMRFTNREGDHRPRTPSDAVTFLNIYADTYGLRHVYFQTFRNMPAMIRETAEWDAEMLRLARAAGIRLVVGDFSMGYPGVGSFAKADNRDLWPAYYPALAELSKSGADRAWLGLQLYIGGAALEMGEAWLSLPLRYRELVATHLMLNRWGNIRIFGTEAGFDAPHMSQAHIGPEQAADTLIALDREWATDFNLVGAALYTLDKSSWAQKGFDMRGTIFSRISAYQAGGPGVIVEAPRPAPKPYGTFTTSALNIRTSPQIAADNKVGQFPANTSVEVVETLGGWARVALWVKQEYLKEI